MNSFRSITAYFSLVLCSLMGFSTLASADNRDEIVFFFNDALGSAVAAINESGELCWDEVYTPYGDKTINDDLVNVIGCGIVGEERGFTGHTEDVNSDLVYMQQRYYDPSIGRFLSIDPMKADPDNPNTYNRYAYANNNPYKYTDPNGEIPVLVWAGYVGVTAAITAYDNYQAYQNGGAAGLGKEVVIGAAMSMVPGGKIGGKAVSTALGATRKADVPSSGKNFAGKQNREQRLKDLVNDDKVSSADRGWIRQEMNEVKAGKKGHLRNPPGKDLAHERGRENAKEYGYEHAHLRNRRDHRSQHKLDNWGRNNAERPFQ